MLVGLHLGNFKAFGELQHFPIRPITLIYGANSAGKSSIIHGILLANHALYASGTSPLDVYSPRLTDAVDLGGFRQYIHRHDSRSHFSFGADVDMSDLLPPTRNFFSPAKQISLFYNIGGPDPIASLSSSGSIRMLEAPRVLSFMLSLDKDLFLTSPGSGIIVNTAHPFCVTLVDRVLEEADLPGKLTPRDYSVARTIIEQGLRSYTLQFNSLRPYVDSTRSEPYDQASARASIRSAVASGNREGLITAAVASYLPTFLSGITEHIAVVTEDTFDEISYLGPLRSYPPRRLIPRKASPADQSVRSGTWERLASDDLVRSEVNNWLSAADRLQTPYEFVVREWLETKSLYDQLGEYQKDAMQLFGVRIAERETEGPITFAELYHYDLLSHKEFNQAEADDLQFQISSSR